MQTRFWDIRLYIFVEVICEMVIIVMADEKTSSLLRQWNFDKYLEVFKDQEVDYEALICLKEKDLIGLIPKAGPRAKFCKKLEAHKFAELEVTIIPETLSLLDENKVEVIATNITENDSSEYFLNTDNIDSDNSQNIPSCRSTQEEFIEKNFVEFNSTHTLPSTSHTLPPKQQQTTNDILQIIDKDLDAKAAYNILKNPNEKKKETARAKLCASIIKHELTNNPVMRIQQHRLKELAEQIQECIPGEIKETYFVPYKKLLNKKLNAKDKLYDKYVNYMKHLRNNGLVPQSSTNNETQTRLVASENMKGQLEWLRTHKDPFEDVKERWEATHDVRFEMLQNSTQTIFDYINEFSVLQLSFGYILLLLDFKKLYPDNDLHMWSKWPSFSQKICALMNLEDQNDLSIFISLGKLFTPTIIRLENGKRWKPNAQEVLDGFLLHVKVNNDITPCIERIVSRAQHMKYKVQPLIVAVGVTLAECRDFYVVIDKNYYHFNDCKTAVDVCFKAIHALHAHYPPQSETIWYFLQQGLYELKTRWDKVIPQVSKQLKNLQEVIE